MEKVVDFGNCRYDDSIHTCFACSYCFSSEEFPFCCCKFRDELVSPCDEACSAFEPALDDDFGSLDYFEEASCFQEKDPEEPFFDPWGDIFDELS